MNVMGYEYRDIYFENTSEQINPSLAVMSMILSYASIQEDQKTSYAGQSRNLTNVLQKIGYTKIETNADYRRRPTPDSFGVLIGQKRIVCRHGIATVLAIVPRSGNYEQEWASNFKIDQAGDSAGFHEAGQKILEFARTYIARNAIHGTVKIWLMGHSRGAAAANAAGAMLDDDPDALGIRIAEKDIYVYTISSPLVTDQDADTAASYHNIFNYACQNDVITMVPFGAWGFRRYGRDIILPVDIDQILPRLKKTGDEKTCQKFMDHRTKYDPSLFCAKKVDLSNHRIVDLSDNDSVPPFACDLHGFIQERIAYLVSHLIPDRQTYTEIYQGPVLWAVSGYCGLSLEKKAAFKETVIKENMKMTCAMMEPLIYAYHQAWLRGDTKINERKQELQQIINQLFLMPLADSIQMSSTEREYFLSGHFVGPLIDIASCILFGYEQEDVENKYAHAYAIELAVTCIGNAAKLITGHLPSVVLSQMMADNEAGQPIDMIPGWVQLHREILQKHAAAVPQKWCGFLSSGIAMALVSGYLHWKCAKA